MQTLPPLGFEPSLSEALDDPIVQQLMSSDGVSRAEVVRLMALADAALRRREWRPDMRPPGAPQ